MIRAETIEARTPTPRVTPNPRTGPEARNSSSPAAIRVVTLESTMALHALSNPARRAPCRPAGSRVLRAVRPDAYSSLARSKTSTLASIARPMARTNPANPGSVNVAPIVTRAA